MINYTYDVLCVCSIIYTLNIGEVGFEKNEEMLDL